MTTTAIVMMLIAILVIWGGLVVAIVNLSKRGDAAAQDIRDVRTAGRHRDR